MKVLCIDDNWAESMRREGDPKINDIDEVLREYEWNGFLIYVLHNRPNPLGYYAPCFIPLSSIDETEFERNYKKELV